VCGWLMSLSDNGDAVDPCCGAESGHPLLKKKRPQEVRPEAASISGVRVTVVSASVQKKRPLRESEF
jgi:hypothetical protein